MSFTVLIPARLASTRLPRKALADLGGVPMVVRVAQRAALSNAAAVVVAADDEAILAACAAHGVRALATRGDHSTGSDRLAEACAALRLGGAEVVVNVQGDEPLIEPELIDACAALLAARPDCAMSTAAHEIADVAELRDPNVVKVVCSRRGDALYFSRAPIPWWRDGSSVGLAGLAAPPPLRHIGIYAYRAEFLLRYPQLDVSPLEAIESLEQLRVLWHGERIAVHLSPNVPEGGVDTLADLLRVRTAFESSAGG